MSAAGACAVSSSSSAVRVAGGELPTAAATSLVTLQGCRGCCVASLLLLLLLLWAAALKALPQLLHTAQPLAITQLIVVILTAWCSSTQSMRARARIWQVLAAWRRSCISQKSSATASTTGLVAVAPAGCLASCKATSLWRCSTMHTTPSQLLVTLADSDTQLHAARLTKLFACTACSTTSSTCCSKCKRQICCST
jgi:hypothetical protein